MILSGLDARFRRAARRYPGQVALEVDTDLLTYVAMDDLASRLGGILAARVGRPPAAVGLVYARSAKSYVGYLAASRVGASVVPVNPVLPLARSAELCAAAGVDVLIVDDSTVAYGSELSGEIGVAMVELAGRGWRDNLGGGPTRPHLASARKLERPAYVLFTSGSTGRPKGIPIHEEQVGCYLDWCARRYGVRPGHRLSQTFELSFDPSVFDLFVAWSSGATVVVPSLEELLVPAQFVARRRLTHWFSVPSVISLARQLGGLRPGSMPGLRCSLFAGERLTVEQATAWSAAAPHSMIENLYGPTELTVTCAGFRLPSDPVCWPLTPNGTVPIGRPYPHLQAAVVDENGAEAAEGELCVRGPQRLRGYLDPADNRGRFLRSADHRGHRGMVAVEGVPDIDDWYRTGDRVRWQDDELLHLGRTDDQLKINGYRVEPGDIETALRTHPAVHEVAVVGRTLVPTDTEICAFYTGRRVVEDELLQHVSMTLPQYMVPARFWFVERLPLTVTGKTDRPRLREMLTHRVGDQREPFRS